MNVRRRASGRSLGTIAAVGLLLAAKAGACGPASVRGVTASGTNVEFVLSREGGRCVTERGGALCRLTLVVRDDGTWEASGTLPPAPARGAVDIGAASRLAALVDDGWEALTARPFTGTCPSAYDAQELSYTIRRLPEGPETEPADAQVRRLRGCVYDLQRPEARGVLRNLEQLWQELGLPD